MNPGRSPGTLKQIRPVIQTGAVVVDGISGADPQWP